MDLYESITDSIIGLVENNPGDWHKPWRTSAGGGLPNNAVTKKPYRGINILQLWSRASEKGYTSSTWATYKQWSGLGAQVRRGEKAATIVFYGKAVKPPDNTEGESGTYRFIKPAWVFNAAQVDGYTLDPDLKLPDLATRVEAVDQFIAKTKAAIKHGGEKAYYSPQNDIIAMPDSAAFENTASASATENYYSVLLHELTHWTGVETRCDRNLKGRFGDNAYAAEELVAELGAAFLGAILGIEVSPRLDHAQYVKNWLAVLKSDKKAIFTAASKASAACDYLHTLQ